MALKDLLENVFGKAHLSVDFSSDQQAGGGIPPGAQWLPWIIERITRADKTYVLLTPNSMKRPWVLWESGAAAGVALAMNKTSLVVPITFGINDADIPSPLLAAQRVRGDTNTEDGVIRLLQDINLALGEPLTGQAFALTIDAHVPGFIAKAKAFERPSPIESLLASVPHSFSAEALGGFWVTCYQYNSLDRGIRCHADIAQVTPESDRRVTAKNYPPEPRTQDRASPFRNIIEAELANRHLIGHWKNSSDTRYFGSIHLAVLPGETVMEGYYTSLSSDIQVDARRWKWVRLDPMSLSGVELSQVVLKEPDVIYTLVEEHSRYDAPLALAAVVEGN